MNFHEVLGDLVKSIDGCSAGFIMGFDGVGVEEFLAEGSELDLSTLGVEYCTALAEVRRTAESLKAGTVHEVAVQTESALIIMRPINAEYFVGLVLMRSGNFGKGRYYLRRAVRELAPDF